MNGSGSESFSAEEKAAMTQRAAENRADARRLSAEARAAADSTAVAEKIAAMSDPDRSLAERLGVIVGEVAPDLVPKLYYGQPGWAKAGKVVVFFRSGIDDKARYSTLGFSGMAALDDESGLWPTSYAVTKITDASAALIAEWVARAAR